MRAKVENSFAPQLFHNLVASVQAADGGVGGMARSARNYELAIAALAGALATVTFLFLWERSSIEAAAKALEATRADRSRPVEWRTSYWPALGLLPPDHQGQIDEVGPIESDSPYDVFSPYLHNAPANKKTALFGKRDRFVLWRGCKTSHDKTGQQRECCDGNARKTWQTHNSPLSWPGSD